MCWLPWAGVAGGRVDGAQSTSPPSAQGPEEPTCHQAAARGSSQEPQGRSGLAFGHHSPSVRSRGPESAAVRTCTPDTGTSHRGGSGREVVTWAAKFGSDTGLTLSVTRVWAGPPPAIPRTREEAALRPLFVESKRNPTPVGLTKGAACPLCEEGSPRFSRLGPGGFWGTEASSPQSVATTWDSRT